MYKSKETRMGFFIRLCFFMYICSVSLRPDTCADRDRTSSLSFSLASLTYPRQTSKHRTSLLSEIAPIHRQRNTRDPRGVIASQEDRAFGHIGHVAPLPPRGRGQHAGVNRFVFVVHFRHGRLGDCKKELEEKGEKAEYMSYVVYVFGEK